MNSGTFFTEGKKSHDLTHSHPEPKHTGLWVAVLTQQVWPALGHFRSHRMSPEKALDGQISNYLRFLRVRIWYGDGIG